VPDAGEDLGAEKRRGNYGGGGLRSIYFLE